MAAERFPVAANVSPAPTPAAAPSLSERKRQTLKVVVAIMAGMAALALVFALMTRNWRREHDFKYKTNPAVPVVVEPSRLLGLAYLPTGCNVAAALQVAALADDDTGRVLLREPRPTLLEPLRKPLARAGLTLADVDHVVIGSEVTDLSPYITTVIITRTPYDPALVKQAAEQQPMKPGTFRNRPVYRFTGESNIPKLWCAGERVLVYTTLTAEGMERIPTTFKEPAETLTPAARDALTARLDKQSRIWAVGDLGPAKALIDTLQLQAQLFGGSLKEQAHLLTLVRAFDLGITTGEAQSVTVRADLYTGNPAATQELGKYLNSVTVAGVRSQKVETPPADLHAPEAQWVSWQMRGDAEALREAVNKMPLAGAGKGPQ